MRHVPFLLAFAVAVPSLHSAEAVVKVVIGQSSAPVNSPLKTGSKLITGSKSHSEVELTNGVVRAGSQTSLQVAGEDTVVLDKGIAVIAAKPRTFFRRPVNVQTPHHTVKVRGTAQVFHEPGHSIRVVALEGSVTIALESLRGESVTLRAGQELIINPSETKLPRPIEIDLTRLLATARLLDSRHSELPTKQIIATTSSQQQEDVGHEDLAATGLVMGDASFEVDVRPEELVHEEVADEISDLDGDGQPDPDALAADGEDLPQDGENADNADTQTDDNTDNADGDTNAARKRAAPGHKKVVVKSKPQPFRITNSTQLTSMVDRLRNGQPVTLADGGQLVPQSQVKASTASGKPSPERSSTASTITAKPRAQVMPKRPR